MKVKINPVKDQLLAPHAIDMLMDFYSIKGEKSPQELYARASQAWSAGDDALAQRLYDAVSNKWFMFASPVLSNAPDENGKATGLPISCFLGYVPDTVDGLIDHSSELRRLSVMGGGVGGHWSDVRSVSNIAPGPIPFLHTVDADMTAYRQGKTRKGSYAAYLDITHPDILEFIGLRVPTGDTNRKAFNLHNAVNITDDFMNKVQRGETYELIDPKVGPTGNFLDARTVWQKLLETRFRTGEPYLNFIDTANLRLPFELKSKGLKIHGSNLCNEIHLPTGPDRTAVCCLSSLNLEFYDDWKDTSLVSDLITMLDNVLEYFIKNAPPSLAKAVYSATMSRDLGLGTMGFHEYLQSKSIAFESDEAQAVNQAIFKRIQAQAVAQSVALAYSRGPAPDMYPTMRRNSHLIALAPNASSGSILGTSPSIETAAANAFTHRTRGGSVLIKSKYLTKVLESLGKNTDDVWQSIIVNKGSVQHLDFLSDHQKRVYKTSFEIDQIWVIHHAADRQPYICQGQSVNVFFPAGSDKSYVNRVHMAAWELGLKGLYYLRTEAAHRAENVSTKVERIKLEETKSTIIYGKPNCPECAMAKNLLNSRGVEYEYVDISTTGKSAAEITGRPDVRSLPQVYLNGEYVGGFKALYDKINSSVTPDTGDECKACEG
jgi:ribonucleoside-diphosphate reductase alpha chain